MTLLYKAVVGYTNFYGAPGANVLWFSQGTPPVTTDEMAQAINDDLWDVYTDLTTLFLSGVTISIPSEFTVVEDDTGNVVDTVVASSPHADIVGTASGTDVPRSTAACVAFNTDLFRNSKRLQGRSFLGPIGSNILDTQGNISSANRTAVDAAYAAIISGVGPRLAVYHRPTSHLAADGYYADVVNVRTLALPSNLHSRRQ